MLFLESKLEHNSQYLINSTFTIWRYKLNTNLLLSLIWSMPST